MITFEVSSVSIHTVPLTWCFLGSGDISCGMNLIGPLICLLDLLVPSGSVSMAISASSLLAWSHSEHCLRRRKRAPLTERYWFYYQRPKSGLCCKRNKLSRLVLIKCWKTPDSQYSWVEKKNINKSICGSLSSFG